MTEDDNEKLAQEWYDRKTAMMVDALGAEHDMAGKGIMVDLTLSRRVSLGTLTYTSSGSGRHWSSTKYCGRPFRSVSVTALVSIPRL